MLSESVRPRDSSNPCEAAGFTAREPNGSPPLGSQTDGCSQSQSGRGILRIPVKPQHKTGVLHWSYCNHPARRYEPSGTGRWQRNTGHVSGLTRSREVRYLAGLITQRLTNAHNWFKSGLRNSSNESAETRQRLVCERPTRSG